MVKKLQKARAELEKSGSKHKTWLPYYINLSAVYNNTGRFFRQQKWLYLAMDHFREAEWKSRKNGFSLNQAEALYDGASTYLALDRQNDAQACTKAAETLTPENSVMRFFCCGCITIITLRQKRKAKQI